MRFIFSCLILTLASPILFTQTDSIYTGRIAVEASDSILSMDAIYNRPFLQMGKTPVLLGGYVEANSSWFGSVGISEGLSFQIPRLTVFVSANIYKRIKFLSEIELEEGGKEIAIEFAAVDLSIHPLLNLRGGVVMNPIGAFNQNHDGPKWEFVSRPIASTSIIPSTWSNVGFGLFGKYAKSNWVFAYEAYLTNGFDDQIIQNSENRTWLPASKKNEERFSESFNGVPLTTLKGAIRRMDFGEIGLSWMGGVYNKLEEDGLDLDRKRRVDVIAVDFNSTINASGTHFKGEFIWAYIDVPSTYSQQFGEKQVGGFIDVVQPILQTRFLGWEHSILNLALRLEYVDYNVGSFSETGGKIFDDIKAIVPALSFRPTAQTVFRFNCRLHWEKDLLGNPSVYSVGYQFGLSSYF